jgi:LAS superfamily LD-carboxypeptidase LdcB
MTSLATAAASPYPVGAASAADARTQQQELRKKKAALAAQVDTLKATNNELAQALGALDDNLRAEQVELDAANEQVTAIETEVTNLTNEQDAAQTRVDALRTQMTESAIDRYMHPTSNQSVFVAQTADINEAVAKQAMLDFTSARNNDAAEQYRAAIADLDSLQTQKADALARAQAARDDVAVRVASVSTARDQQANVVNAAKQRINGVLEDADIVNKDLKTADAAVKQQEEKEAKELAALQERLNRSKGGATPPPANVTDMVWVSGPGGQIQIHKSLSSKLSAMLAAAGADGVGLGGSGYRGSERQIELRRQNCGSSDYAIYKMPPFSCRPPTALPGSSNHERGLAVDFSVNGVMLSRGSAGYNWLSRNAAKYGFYNLPSEAWHWSYDGN